jgi:hypothetical protein
MINYRVIKQLAKELKCSIKDLIALSPQNDPFYVGSPSEMKGAEWFAELWQQFGYSDGVHLRRVHYKTVSQETPVFKPNGKPYENTQNDWQYLCNTGKWARYLDFVPAGHFVDRRNPDAILYAYWNRWLDPTPNYSLNSYDWDDHNLPGLPQLDRLPYSLPDLPDFSVDGYTDIQQDYHVEVWAEKTTMNDVLDPLCKRFDVNLITGAGEMSITAVLDFMERVKEARRPARILYISDFDPAGLGMPISVARKAEFFHRNRAFGGLDIRLQPIVLTSDQVGKYSLPRVPVKDSDLRKATFEADHGQGQVELDALEALYPGELASIVESAILDYYDPTLVERAREERAKLVSALGKAQQRTVLEHRDEIIELQDDYESLCFEFDETRQRFDELIAEFQSEIDEHKERLDDIRERGQELYGRIHGELDEVDVDVEDYPLPEPELPTESNGLLYISERDYIDQIVSYKAYRHGDNGKDKIT